MTRLFFLLIIFLPFFVSAQPITGPEQDCTGALQLQGNIFVQPNSYQGIGNVQEINGNISCLDSEETNSVWYTFTVYRSGLLEFSILPNGGGDYDFTLFNLTGGSCADIPGGTANEVRCSYAFSNGPTGLQTGYASVSEGPGGLPFLAPLQVVVGETYFLLIDNFGLNLTGYTLDFSGSTANLSGIFFQVEPYVVSGNPCQGDTIILDAGISGGSGNYIVSWAGSIPVDQPDSLITSAIIPDSGSYTFQVEVIDITKGDTLTGSITINTSGEMFEADAGADVSIGCSGATVASLTATVTTGNGAGADFRWSNGITGPYMEAVPGSYTVTVTDAGGCLQDVDQITVFGPLDFSFNHIHENCGAGDGKISVSVTGAIGTVKYLWSTGDTTAIVTGLSAGIYALEISDNFGCHTVDSIVVLDSCGVISGTIFNDINANGIPDAGETGMGGVEVIASSGVAGLSNSNGFYEIIVPGYGNYTVQIDTPYRFYCFNSLLWPDSITTPSGGYYSLNIDSINRSANGNDFGLTAPTLPCGEIGGHVFKDINQNRIEDSAETGYPNIMIQIDPVGFAFTGVSGDYLSDAPFNVPLTISGPASSYTYFCGGNNRFLQTYPAGGADYNVTLTPFVRKSLNNDFGYSLDAENFDVGIYNVRPDLPDPCQNFMVWMDWKMKDTIPADCYLLMKYDSFYVNFVSSMPPADTVGAGFIGWHFPAGTFQPGFACYGMVFQLDCQVPTGTILPFTGIWSCATADGCPVNDSLRRETVVGNILRRQGPEAGGKMEVLHQNDQNKPVIQHADSSFSYIISFRNTSWDTIYRMCIVDTLPPYFQLNTVSHPFSNKSFDFKVRNDNVLVWEFKNINLPPARDDLLSSSGFVQYNVIMKPHLPSGTIFQNTAYITYNFSEPVRTNTVENVLTLVEIGEEAISDPMMIKAHPNPNNGRFIITGNAQAPTDWSIKLYSVTGARTLVQLVKSQKAFNLSIGSETYPKGVYLLRVENNQRVITKKIIIQ